MNALAIHYWGGLFSLGHECERLYSTKKGSLPRHGPGSAVWAGIVWVLEGLMPLRYFFSYFSSFCHSVSFMLLPSLSSLVTRCCFPIMPHSFTRLPKAAVRSEDSFWTHFLSPLFHTSPHCEKCISHLPPISASWKLCGLLDSWKH